MPQKKRPTSEAARKDRGTPPKRKETETAARLCEETESALEPTFRVYFFHGGAESSVEFEGDSVLGSDLIAAICEKSEVVVDVPDQGPLDPRKRFNRHFFARSGSLVVKTTRLEEPLEIGNAFDPVSCALLEVPSFAAVRKLRELADAPPLQKIPCLPLPQSAGPLSDDIKAWLRFGNAHSFLGHLAFRALVYSSAMGPIASELDLSEHVGVLIHDPLRWLKSVDSDEKLKSVSIHANVSPDSTHKPDSKPDCSVFFKGASQLLSEEDKISGSQLPQALEEIAEKARFRSGDGLWFQLGLALSKDELQLFFLADKEKLVGDEDKGDIVEKNVVTDSRARIFLLKELSLNSPEDRCRAIFLSVNIYRMLNSDLKRMAAAYKKINAARKKSANAQFLVDARFHRPKSGPFVEVCTPGLCREPCTEDELKDALRSVLRALQILHDAEYAHYDVRWPNIIRAFNPPRWVLIDLEDVQPFGTKGAPELVAHPPNRLEPVSAAYDLWMVGKLIETVADKSIVTESTRSLASKLMSANPEARGTVDEALENL